MSEKVTGEYIYLKGEGWTIRIEVKGETVTVAVKEGDFLSSVELTWSEFEELAQWIERLEH